MKCPNCGIDSPGPFCSGCGSRIETAQQGLNVQNTNPQGKKKVPIGCLTVIISFILIYALISAFGSSPSSTPNSNSSSSQTTTSSEASKPDLEIVEHHSEAEQYSRYVLGTVKNNTSNEYSYVQVEINLYDDAGNQVGSTMDNTTNLEPGGTWKFKALMLEDSATKYKVKGVTGY